MTTTYPGLWNWLKFLKVETEEDLAMIGKKDPAIKKAAKQVYKFRWGERRQM